MNADTLIDHVADILQEDFTYSTLWTKAEILEYLRLILREFSQRTLIADKMSLRIANSSGECELPDDFLQTYYVTFDGAQTDIVTFADLDLVDSDWLDAGTGTAKACTVIGDADDALLRFVPVPNSLADGLEGGFTELQIVSGTAVYDITVDDGELTAGLNATASPTGVSTGFIVREPDNTRWRFFIDAASGDLDSETSYDTTSNAEYLFPDSIDGIVYGLYASAAGVSEVQDYTLGCGIKAYVDDVDTEQDFNQEVGIIVDAYVEDVDTSSTDMCFVDGPVGCVAYARSQENAAQVWYKGHVPDTPKLQSTVFVRDAYIPVIIHGVLAMCYAKDGDARDSDKASLLYEIFKTECESIKRIFNRRYL